MHRCRNIFSCQIYVPSGFLSAYCQCSHITNDGTAQGLPPGSSAHLCYCTPLQTWTISLFSTSNWWYSWTICLALVLVFMIRVGGYVLIHILLPGLYACSLSAILNLGYCVRGQVFHLVQFSYLELTVFKRRNQARWKQWVRPGKNAVLLIWNWPPYISFTAVVKSMDSTVRLAAVFPWANLLSLCVSPFSQF